MKTRVLGETNPNGDVRRTRSLGERTSDSKAAEDCRTPRRFAKYGAHGDPTGLGVRQSSAAFPRPKAFVGRPTAARSKITRFATLLLLSGTLLLTGPEASGAASDAARAELRGYIENVTQANGRRYGTTDNSGHSMDTAKIIANPNVSGQFIAVFHTYFNGVPKVNLATSTDLLNWTWVRELAGSGNGGASQPTIKASGTGFVMGWEQENVGGGGNHVKLVYFSSWANLQNGVVSKSYDAPMVFSTCANGTPNLYSASSTSCDVGFHYFKNCDVDRQARATCNWSSWNATKQTGLDNAILYWGIQGNIGDRDGKARFRGYDFGMIEGQYTKNDFGSWRCFLYDYQTGNADQLSIHTDGGSVAFGNPTIELVTFNGQSAVVIGLFMFSEGVRGGDPAGELIYYRYY